MKTKFYESLRQLRTDRGYTQSQMADALRISRPTYSNYESGKRSPDLGTLEEISMVLNCSLDELFGRSIYSMVREESMPYSVKKKPTYSGNRQRKNKEMKLGIGIQDFRKLRERNSYYVDKTVLIQEFLESDIDVTLITRPRRFGKTLNMSMLAEFLDYRKNSKDIFSGTKISQTEYIYEQNQHPVVFLSFLNAKGDTEEELLMRIYDVIQTEYERHWDVLNNQELPDYRRQKAKNIYMSLRPAKSAIEVKDTVVMAITELCQILKEYYGKSVYLLIDEYDTPFISANSGGYYGQVRNFLSIMFGSALKGNTSLEKALLTGIQRVAKENIFSGLNNIAVCTVKDPEYAEYFGFTASETRELLNYYGLELTDDVRRMYDGYLFGNVEFYNPWAVTFYASRKELEAYWVNTSENSIIEQAMDRCGERFQREYEKLLEQGQTIVHIELDNFFYEQPETAALWGMLVNAGMVTITEKIEDDYYRIRIPNEEVSKAFQRLTAHNLQVEHSCMVSMIQSLKRGALEEFAEEYRRIILKLPSYHDLKDENSYHMMMLGMCAYLYGEYEVQSNRESGQGRSDIMLKPLKASRPGIILEFKYTKDHERDLYGLAKEALGQIQEKEYGAAMEGERYYVGLAHCGKHVEVVWKTRLLRLES